MGHEGPQNAIIPSFHHSPAESGMSEANHRHLQGRVSVNVSEFKGYSIKNIFPGTCLRVFYLLDTV